MNPTSELEVLVLVKAYPNPSRKYGETVCVAGVTGDSQRWVRLYPVDFRHLPEQRRFEKWQWIRVAVAKSRQDYRKESYIPVQDSITPLHRVTDWQQRRQIVDRLLFPSLESLRDSDASLGVVRPLEVQSFGWSPKEEAAWTRRRCLYLAPHPAASLAGLCADESGFATTRKTVIL